MSSKFSLNQLAPQHQRDNSIVQKIDRLENLIATLTAGKEVQPIEVVNKYHTLGGSSSSRFRLSYATFGNGVDPTNIDNRSLFFNPTTDMLQFKKNDGTIVDLY